jgi:hypothetical protein
MKKLIYSKDYIFRGRVRKKRYYCDITKDWYRFRQKYHLELCFMPYTWKIGLHITFRSDFKCIGLNLFNFSVAFMTDGKEAVTDE